MAMLLRGGTGRWLALPLLAALLGSLPLLCHPGLPHGSDLSFHLLYARGFEAGLSEGLLYPRLVPDANGGYGAPVFVFYPPLAYYGVALIQQAVGQPLEALRWAMVLGLALAGAAFFLSVRPLYGERAAALGACLYVLLPYPLFDLYERFALAEFLGLIFLPPVLAGLERTVKDGSSRFGLRLAVAGLLLTHLLLASITLVALMAWAACRRSGLRRAGGALLVTVLAALLLTSCYWLPLMAESSQLDPADLSSGHFHWKQHFLYQPEAPGDRAGPWAALAASATLLLTLSGMLLLRRDCPGWAWAALSLWSFLLQTSLSAPLWALCPGLELVQFPWRFGALQTVGCCLLWSSLLATPPARRAWALLLVPTLAALAASTWIAAAARPFDFDRARGDEPAYRYREVREYMPPSASQSGSTPAPRWWTESAGSGSVETWRPHRRALRVQLPEAGNVWLRAFSYPGWEVTVDGQPAPLLPGKLLGVEVGAGEHRLEFTFRDTRDRRLGGWLSLAGLVLLLARRAPAPSEEDEDPLAPAPVGLWRLAAGVSFWSFGFTVMAAGDLWWHLATGRLLLDEGRIVTADPWSFSHFGGPWIQHEWLSDVIFAGWAELFGLYSLVYWKWILVVAIYGLLFEALYRRCRDAPSSWLGAFAAAALAAPFLDLRPHLYTLLGTAVLLRVGQRLPIWLPLLFCLWANLHGGVVFGLIVLAASLWASPHSSRRKLWMGLGCLAATLVNPVGWRVLAYPFKYALHPDSPYLALREWRSPFAADPLAAPLYPWALAALAGCLALLVLRPELRRRLFSREFAAGLAVLLLTALMSVKSCRFIPLFGLFLALLLAPCLSIGLGRWRSSWLLAWLALGVGVARLAPYPLQPYAFHYLTAEDSFPVDTLDCLEASQWQGKLFPLYNWGGYVHFRTGGRIPVYVDGRADTVYSDDTFRRYLAILRRDPGWVELLEQTGAEAVLWPAGRPHAHELLAGGRWRLAYRDAVSLLLVRTDEPVFPLRSPPESPYRQLARGIQALERQDPARARVHLEAALAAMPYLKAARQALIRALEAEGEDAQTARREASRYFPQD
ncbi:MAG: hypothetical protein HY319_20905 [Armatimonadetes bacterium]|nr:hypothetical protein [Armatimonadota bacterium]